MELSAGRFPVEQIEDLLKAAQHRWLNADEICRMFDNHEKLPRRNLPPQQHPEDGSFFFIQWGVRRQFRKDGYVWSKKKDLQTIQESHEDLRVGKKPKLTCRYAYLETDENFQRRMYELIEEKDVALFHYREVKNQENNRKGKKVNHGAKEASSQGWMETEDAEFYETLCETEELMKLIEPYL